jgi:transposase-like protein
MATRDWRRRWSDWPGVAHQRCTVHKLRNLLAKAPKHTHEAVREDYHRIVYAETLAAAEKAREALLKWKKPCPGVAASLEEAGENLLTFYRFPESQWLSLRTSNAIERMQLQFRRRVKTQAALPNEGSVLRVFFGLWLKTAGWNFCASPKLGAHLKSTTSKEAL